MTDENEVRKADRAAERAVTDRVEAVVDDLVKGRVGTSDRDSLGEALRRADRNAGVGRAIRPL
jgi:hypothetical protein